MAENTDQPTQAETDNGDRLVPVSESIKYRRRAQKAEGRVAQLEQQLTEMQSQLDALGDELARAEAQRDEAAQRLVEAENRLTAERLMAMAGVADTETAVLLLSKRIDLTQELAGSAIADAVEELLVDKPFLRSGQESSLPGATASAKPSALGGLAALADAAERAIASGDRRDVAEYLRLRRQNSFSYL